MLCVLCVLWEEECFDKPSFLVVGTNLPKFAQWYGLDPLSIKGFRHFFTDSFKFRFRNWKKKLNVVFNSLPFWVSAIYFPVKQREKKKKVLARRRGKGKAKRGKKGTK